jgi:hypothetical protein
LMCVMPLMVPTMRSTVHVRGFVKSIDWKCINFPNTLYGCSYIMFILSPFEAGHCIFYLD